MQNKSPFLELPRSGGDLAWGWGRSKGQICSQLGARSSVDSEDQAGGGGVRVPATAPLAGDRGSIQSPAATAADLSWAMSGDLPDVGDNNKEPRVAAFSAVVDERCKGPAFESTLNSADVKGSVQASSSSSGTASAARSCGRVRALRERASVETVKVLGVEAIGAVGAVVVTAGSISLP